MAFQLLGTAPDQYIQADAGTSAISEIALIPGVETKNEGVYISYNSPYRVSIPIGSTVNFNREDKISVEVNSGQCLYLAGELNIDASFVSGVDSVNSFVDSISLYSGEVTANNSTTIPLYVTQDASFNLKGAKVSVSHPSASNRYAIRIEGGASLNFENVYFESNKVIRFFETGDNANASNSTLKNWYISSAAFAYYGIPLIDDGLFMVAGSFTRLAANNSEALNFNSINESISFKNWENSQIYLTDNFYGTNQTLASGNKQDANILFTTVTRGLTGSFKLANGNIATGAKFYIQGYVHGTPINNPNTTLDETLAQNYVIEIDSNGDVVSQPVYMAQMRNLGGGDQNNPNIDYFNKNGVKGEDIFDVAYYGYLYNTLSLTDYRIGNNGSVGSLNISQTYSLDTSVTELDEAVVLAYENPSTNEQLYDLAKLYRVNNEPLNDEPYLDINGDAGDYNVTFLQTGLNFEKVGDTLFINTTNFSGNIKTTKLVTDAAEVVTGGVSDINGDSYLRFTGIATWSAYTTEQNSLVDANSIGSGTVAQIFRYIYVANTTYYLALYTLSGSRITIPVTPEAEGETIVSLDSTSLLQNISSNLEIVDYKVDETKLYANKSAAYAEETRDLVNK